MKDMKPATGFDAEDRRYFHKQSVTDTTSEPLRIPSVGRDAAVNVVPGTDAVVEYSVSSYVDIENGTATWTEWPVGTVTAASNDTVSGSISALRLVLTGTSTWEVSV